MLYSVISDKMGNEASLPLEMCATFDADEIKRLGKRYYLSRN